MKQNVSYIPRQDLCCSCGACAEVCGRSAISIVFRQGLFVPEIDESLCVDCKLCLGVCPSVQVDVVSVYGEPELFSNEEKECYVAYSTNEILRRKGTSGGVVSTMVYELLKKGVYQKAYVLEYEGFDGAPAQVRPINQPDDVIRSAKSKYIPASITEVVKDVKNGTIGKAIIVATPCQLLAIKKSLKLKKQSAPDILFIGLFCDKTLNYNIYEYYRVKHGDYDIMHFRDKVGNDWPGDTVLIKEGKPLVVDKRIRMSLKPYFQLNRCRFCFDKLNQLADISCGDCYIKGEEAREGKSSMIIRSEKGESALLACSDVLNLKITTFKEIRESQGLGQKKANYYRNRFAKGAYLLPDEDRIELSKDVLTQDKKELKDLRMGARAVSEMDFARIDYRIKMSEKRHRTSLFKRYLKRALKLFRNPDSSFKVLIENADFENKGGELMLQSIVQQIESRMPNARIVVLNSVFNQNLNYFHRHHVLPMQMDSSRKKRVFRHFVYGIILNKPWYITPDQIDLLLDAGGFQFSDQWETSDREIAERVSYYSLFTKKDRKIVFLPQAFGPFEKSASKRLMKEIYNISDVIYAREKVSYEYLKELFPQGGKIKLAPDFTCLSKSGGLQNVSLPDNYVIIIPNIRMVTHTGDRVSSNYLEFICKTICFLRDRGQFVVLINHEGPDDERLMIEINNKLPQKVLILTELDALEIKRLIAGANLVISSRYHGIVSGLTQHVPTLCTSWSHKYLELLKEHGCEKNVLSVDNLEHSLETIDDAIRNPELYSTKGGYVEDLKGQALKMWDEVFSLVGNKR